MLGTSRPPYCKNFSEKFSSCNALHSTYPTPPYTPSVLRTYLGFKCIGMNSLGVNDCHDI